MNTIKNSLPLVNQLSFNDFFKLIDKTKLIPGSQQTKLQFSLDVLNNLGFSLSRIEYIPMC